MRMRPPELMQRPLDAGLLVDLSSGTMLKLGQAPSTKPQRLNLMVSAPPERAIWTLRGVLTVCSTGSALVQVPLLLVSSQMSQPPRPVRLLGLHAPAGLRAAALRIAFDQRDKAVIGQLLMLGAQAPAGCRAALHARAQALVQQDGAGIERRAANEANMLFE